MGYVNAAVIFSGGRKYKAREQCNSCGKRWSRDQHTAPFSRCAECRIELHKTRPKKKTHKKK